MFSSWIFLALGAAAFQTARNSASKRYSASHGALITAFSRFLYGIPLIAAYMLALFAVGYSVGQGNSLFFLLTLLAGALQIAGSVFLISSFSLKNFSVAVVLSRTEAVIAAVIGFFFLGEHLSMTAALAIVLTTVGIVLLSLPKKAQISPPVASAAPLGRSVNMLSDQSYGILLGLLSGATLALSVLILPHAISAIEGGTRELNAAFTLVVMNILQALGLGVWLYFNRQSKFSTSLTSDLSRGIKIGCLSACGSLCWFTAFTLQSPALVRTVGQSEILFSLLVSYITFKEKLNSSELIGCFLALTGITLLLAAG